MGKATLTYVVGRVVRALNDTASQFVAHSTIVEAVGLPVAAAYGFMPGLMFGLKDGKSKLMKAMQVITSLYVNNIS